jgi:branched-chain amino acid transport system permease protein
VTFLTQLVNGLALGAGYALLAVGWTVLLGAARLVNFAHGQLYMLGAFFTWWAIQNLGVSYFLAIPIAVIGAALLGLGMQLLMTRLTMKQDLVSLMLLTLAFGYLFTGGASLLFGGDPQQIGSPLLDSRTTLFGAQVAAQDGLILVGALALYAATWWVLSKTDVGRIVRGVAEDPKLAQLYGISPAKVYVGVFVFAAACAALAGALIAPQHPILTSIGFEEVIITFVVVVVGGIGNILGGLTAGLGLGVFVALFGAYVSPAYSMPAAFAVLLVFLMVRPQGLKAA